MSTVELSMAGPAPLPSPRGPVSGALLRAITGAGERALPAPAGALDAFGEDVQLALHCCYELHYRGIAGVDQAWEWAPELLRLRAALEGGFLAALRARVPGGDDAAGCLDALLPEPVDATGVSHHLATDAPWWQLREYLALRSVYHLKEADPHAWVIPRLSGRAKAALVAVEFDEFGGGHGERMHSRLYAELLAEAGLEPGYLHYLDRAPAEMLAVVNLMSLCGLHRSLRGALVGHFAAAEISTPPTARRLDQALARHGLGERQRVFFTEHVEADAVHEQIMRRDVVGDLLAREPELAADVVFGVQATELVEDRFAGRVLDAWQHGRSALRPRGDG